MKKILVVIQRSNGDVFLASSLINCLQGYYKDSKIDLLINDDTLGIAKTLKNISKIFLYSYSWRKLPLSERIKKEFLLIRSIYRQYDLSISLTASDRSVLYALAASKNSIASIEKTNSKGWWKKLFLSHFYYFDTTKHILQNNTMPLALLKIPLSSTEVGAIPAQESIAASKKLLAAYGIERFFIFHPSAQYQYKMLNTEHRNQLLLLLNGLNIPIIVTGGRTQIDDEISKALPKLNNIYNFIGHTSLDEYIALSSLSLAYIGMDTLNMHIAAAQNKRIFAIFGPTLTSMWSPWCNQTNSYLLGKPPLYTYNNITIFQALMPCVPCGKAGCDDKHGKSECLEAMMPNTIFKEVEKWLATLV